jgi:chitinase
LKLAITFLIGLLASLSTNVYAVNMAYVEVNSNRFENASCYINSENQKPFFQIAAIFAANINGNNPNEPVIYLNEQVAATLQSKQIQHMHDKGIKVLVTLLGNHQNAGWACMTDATAAERFANVIVNFIDRYQLDGIDIDDEYSKCATNNYSMIMIAKALKSHPGFKNKLLTKALYKDYDYFKSSYQGHKLSEYLDYGWEMTYSNGDFMGRLKPYTQTGMAMTNLMIGAWPGKTYPDAYEIGKFSAQKQLAGMMVYDVKINSQSYLTQLQRGFSNNRDTVNASPGCLGQ